MNESAVALGKDKRKIIQSKLDLISLELRDVWTTQDEEVRRENTCQVAQQYAEEFTTGKLAVDNVEKIRNTLNNLKASIQGQIQSTQEHLQTIANNDNQ